MSLCVNLQDGVASEQANMDLWTENLMLAFMEEAPQYVRTVTNAATALELRYRCQ